MGVQKLCQEQGSVKKQERHLKQPVFKRRDDIIGKIDGFLDSRITKIFKVGRKVSLRLCF